MSQGINPCGISKWSITLTVEYGSSYHYDQGSDTVKQDDKEALGSLIAQAIVCFLIYLFAIFWHHLINGHFN